MLNKIKFIKDTIIKIKFIKDKNNQPQNYNNLNQPQSLVFMKCIPVTY